MKRQATLALCLIIATTVYTQRIQPGLKAGLNLYTIHRDNGPAYDMRTSFHAGFLAHIHLTKQFALQPEVVYSLQGARFTSAGTDIRLDIDYVNVPVLFQYMFNNGFRLQAGPQVGFLVNAKSEAGNIKSDVKSSFKTVDFGLTAGISYIHTPSGLGADARYNFGLSNINETGTVRSFNRGVQVGLFFIPGNH